MNPGALIQTAERLLVARPPLGLAANDVPGFFGRHRARLVALAWPYKVHLVLGMTIFLLFPFSRLVHVWSGFGTLAYLFRPYQLVRSRRLNVPAGRDRPRRSA